MDSRKRRGREERRGDTKKKKKNKKTPRHSETESVSLRAKMWPERREQRENVMLLRAVSESDDLFRCGHR